MTATAGQRGVESVLVEPRVDQSAAGPSTIGEVNRYPGSPPFADTDIDRMLFRGRAVETDEVLHTILSYDLLLVYAVSGMGKTSLLTAGVLEPLRQRGYFPVIVRLNTPDTGMLGLIEQQIRQAAAATPGLEIVHTPTRGVESTAPTTLWDLFAELELWRGNTLQQLVIIFDQFEELFTLTWDADERARFIEQFGEVVRRHRVPRHEIDPTRQALPPPNVKVVLCMREDFIGQLEDLAVSVPQIMHRRFRLGALTPEQAHAAICEPAALDDPRLRTQRFSYTDGAASTILTFLRTKDERGKSVLTAAIDPSQLQIICQHIERSILPGKSARPDGMVEITEADLGGQEGLRRIVGDFYRRVLEEFPPNERKSIRHLCETGLISQTGRRLSQEEGEIHAHFDVTRGTLRRLVDLRLLRSEPRVGSIYYELAHDTLTGPILAYRDAHRRKRRRRLVIAALIAAGVAAAVAGTLLLSRNAGTELAGEAPVFPISVGEEVSGELSSPDLTARYEVAAADQPLVVELRPTGFNGVIEIGRLGDGGTPQTQDVGLSGATEFAVIGSGDEGHRIEVSGSGPGTFELIVRPANIRPLSIPGQLRNMRVPASGEPVVLQVQGSDDQGFVVSVNAIKEQTPVAIPNGAIVQITDPGGTTAQVLPDEMGLVSALGGGTTGTYLVAIGDSSGETKVTYDVSVDPVRITTASVGESVEHAFSFAEPNAVFEINSPDDRALFVELRDTQGASHGEIQAPDGGVQPLFSGAVTALTGGAGRYLVFVTSDVPDRVTVSVDAAEGVDVELGVSVHGTLDENTGVVLYRVQAPGDVPLLAEVTSDDTLDAVLSLVTETESTIGPVDFAATAGTEQMLLPSETRGPQLFAITPYDTSSGDFEFTVRAAPVTAIGIGDTLDGNLEAGGLALYSVSATDDVPFGVAVTGGDEADLALSVEGPRGEEFAQGGNLYVSSGVPGSYTLTVRNYGTAGDFHISVDQPHAASSSAEEPDTGPIGGPGDVELFGVGLVADPTSYVTITTEEGLEVTATVTDAFGNPLAFADAPIAGVGTMAVAGAEGSNLVIVTGVSGSGIVRVAVQSLEPTPLAPGSTVTVDVADAVEVAVFSVEPGEDLVAIDVRPSGGLTVDVTSTDSIGNPLLEGDIAAASPSTLFVDGRMGRVQLVMTAGSGPGEVEIGSRILAPEAIEDGDVVNATIRSPGDVVAYDVVLGGVDQFIASITPSSGLDAHVLVIDPSGFAEVTDNLALGETEDAYLVSGSGLYRVIVSGAADTTGQFELVLGVPTSEEPDLDAVVGYSVGGE